LKARRTTLRRHTVDLPSLEPHVIFDGRHPLDATGHLDRLVDISTGIDEAAQLNRSLEGFDVDLGRFQRRFVEYRRLYLAGNDSVVDILSGPLLRGRPRASENGSQHNGEDKSSETFGKSHGDAPH
jgi:hypothetical protein